MMPESRIRMICDQYDCSCDRLVEMAAVAKNLDLVIAGANMEAQMVAGLEIPVCVMVPHARTWHFSAGRDDCSCWYDSMRLCQEENACWESAMRKVMQEVEKMISRR